MSYFCLFLLDSILTAKPEAGLLQGLDEYLLKEVCKVLKVAMHFVQIC